MRAVCASGRDGLGRGKNASPYDAANPAQVSALVGYTVGNKTFVEQNPAAGNLFEVMSVPMGDISQQNRTVNEGQNQQKDVERHA